MVAGEESPQQIAYANFKSQLDRIEDRLDTAVDKLNCVETKLNTAVTKNEQASWFAPLTAALGLAIAGTAAATTLYKWIFMGAAVGVMIYSILRLRRLQKRLQE